MTGLGSISPFDYSGMASLTDLASPAWRSLFGELERSQSRFQAQHARILDAEYKWPRDPLHTWSRGWEYAYVAHHLGRAEGQDNRVIDFGCGVTFFPFFLAKSGFDVVGIDNDPICERGMKRAIDAMDSTPGSVSIQLSRDGRLDMPDGSVSAAYSVSVLEHIPTLEPILAELARVMRPGARFVLTIDVGLEPGQELDPDRYTIMRGALSKAFELVHAERTTHPLDMLTTDTGPYPKYGSNDAVAWLRRKAKRTVRRLLDRQPWEYSLACAGFVLRRT